MLGSTPDSFWTALEQTSFENFSLNLAVQLLNIYSRRTSLPSPHSKFVETNMLLKTGSTLRFKCKIWCKNELHICKFRNYCDVFIIVNNASK